MPSPNQPTTTTQGQTQVQLPLTLQLSIKDGQYDALQQALQQQDGNINKAIQAIGTIHFARICLTPDKKSMLVITSYDEPLENYLQDIVKYLGEIFTQLFTDFIDIPQQTPPLLPLTAQSLGVLFISNDIPVVGSFYSAYPTLTVKDILEG